MGPKRPTKPRKKKKKVSMPVAANAAEAVRQTLESTAPSSSSKINYEAVKGLFEVSPAQVGSLPRVPFGVPTLASEPAGHRNVKREKLEVRQGLSHPPANVDQIDPSLRTLTGSGEAAVKGADTSVRTVPDDVFEGIDDDDET